MPDPIINDDDAATIFQIEEEIASAERDLEAVNERRKEIRETLAEALYRRAKFTRGLKERHPLFDQSDDDEPLRIAQ